MSDQNYINKSLRSLFAAFSFIFLIQSSGCSQSDDYPDPANNPMSPLMLKGDWFDHSHDIDFDNLPKIPSEHSMVSDITIPGKNMNDVSDVITGSWGVNQHSYLAYYDDRFWVLWSDGPGNEDRVGQVVKYSTSEDGLIWSDPEYLTPYPPNSGPDSPYYNTHSEEGFRWIARGFWQRGDGHLLALVSLDEAAGFFGPSLELRAFRWDKDTRKWKDIGQVKDNAINNFPPKRLPTGEWMMSRRQFDYSERGVDFLVGGIDHLNDWESFPVLGSDTELYAEEPYWWILPDEESLMALFRDNHRSGYLYRSFSTDNGRTWSRPVQTNFPDVRSKFNGLRLSDGRYVLVSNPNPIRRDPLALSISDDGMVFHTMGYLTGGRHIDYPHVIEHEGYLYIAYAGSIVFDQSMGSILGQAGGEYIYVSYAGWVKATIEVLKVRISDLDDIDMSKMKDN